MSVLVHQGMVSKRHRKEADFHTRNTLSRKPPTIPTLPTHLPTTSPQLHLERIVYPLPDHDQLILQGLVGLLFSFYFFTRMDDG